MSKKEADNHAQARAAAAKPGGGESLQPSCGADAENGEQLKKLEEEVRQAKEQQLRLIAEVDNTKKRLQREKDEFVRFAAEGVIRGLLPIIDSLQQALAASEKKPDAEELMKGVQLIHKQILGLLEKEGVKRIPTIGERFDPHLHEAISRVGEGSDTEEEFVVEEFQAGYTLHGKVLRSAMVKIGPKNENVSGGNENA